RRRTEKIRGLPGFDPALTRVAFEVPGYCEQDLLKRIVRYTVRVAAVILCILVLGWLCLAGYLYLNKDSLLTKARTQLKTRLGDRCRVEGLDFSLFSHFPHVTIRLSGVLLRDSLWDQHHKDLLQADEMYVRLSLFRSLFAGKLRVGKVYL